MGWMASKGKSEGATAVDEATNGRESLLVRRSTTTYIHDFEDMDECIQCSSRCWRWMQSSSFVVVDVS